MLTLAKLGILAVIAAGVLSLFTGFSLHDGFHRPPPPVNVVRTHITVERPPPAHWAPATGAAHGGHHGHHVRLHIPHL